MKKSNIILLSATAIAIIWILIIGWFAASAIRNYIHGKDPHFARTHQQFLESRRKCFLAPTRELVLFGDSNTMLSVRPGKELAVLAHPRIWDVAYTDLGKGISMIRLHKRNEENDNVTITVPTIRSLSFQCFSEVLVTGLTGKEIHLQGRKVRSFIADSCRFGSWMLDFPENRDRQDIFIGRSNRIDTLIATVRGSGKISMETAGQFKNQIILSDSIHVEATSGIMKKLAIGTESRILNK
jgi:hypothetical protein